MSVMEWRPSSDLAFCDMIRKLYETLKKELLSKILDSLRGLSCISNAKKLQDFN